MKVKLKVKGLIIPLLLSIAAVIAACLSKQYYHYAYRNFVAMDSVSHSYKVYPNTPLDSVIADIEQDYHVCSELSWHLMCQLKDFNTPKTGYYTLPSVLSNRELIRRLQLGEQTPVKLSFTQAIRTPEQLAAHLGERLMLDSTDIIQALKSFHKENIPVWTMFLPNTYEVWWTLTPEQLINRMQREYDSFWTEERQAKAKALSLSPYEVQILASIVASETNRRDEHPLIASLYLNRLRKGIPLQACPTVIYAHGLKDPQALKMRRVLKRHLSYDSPYNTYIYRGLPPTPIRLTRPDVIDAVLNAPRTDYLYMCANPDFSGTHIFSSSYAKHSAVARQYQRELNNRKIK